jgi:hypothetical protein
MACNARAAPNWAYIFQERQWYRPQATQQKGLKVRRGGAIAGRIKKGGTSSYRQGGWGGAAGKSKRGAAP